MPRRACKTTYDTWHQGFQFLANGRMEATFTSNRRIDGLRYQVFITPLFLLRFPLKLAVPSNHRLFNADLYIVTIYEVISRSGRLRNRSLHFPSLLTSAYERLLHVVPVVVSPPILTAALARAIFRLILRYIPMSFSHVSHPCASIASSRVILLS